jgi:hypothetical protein
MKKAKEAPATVAEAREAIRGASGIVDGVRVAYALWAADPKYARKVCRDLLVPFTPNRVVQGAIVKANEPVNRDIATYVRTDDGVLRDRTADLRKATMANQEDALVDAIAARAAAGRPLMQTGQGGLYEHRESLPQELRAMGRHRLVQLCSDLIDEGRVVKCIGPGSNVAKWLDVPGGQFAEGVGMFVRGAVS